jgi:hypothetical protein
VSPCVIFQRNSTLWFTRQALDTKRAQNIWWLGVLLQAKVQKSISSVELTAQHRSKEAFCNAWNDSGYPAGAPCRALAKSKANDPTNRMHKEARNTWKSKTACATVCPQSEARNNPIFLVDGLDGLLDGVGSEEGHFQAFHSNFTPSLADPSTRPKMIPDLWSKQTGFTNVDGHKISEFYSLVARWDCCRATKVDVCLTMPTSLAGRDLCCAAPPLTAHDGCVTETDKGTCRVLL